MIKNYTYTIEVDTNPHTWDNKYKPYFWIIWSIDEETGNRANSGSCGWAETVETAWAEAYAAYQRRFARAVEAAAAPTKVEPSVAIISELSLNRLMRSVKRHKNDDDLHSFQCKTATGCTLFVEYVNEEFVISFESLDSRTTTHSGSVEAAVEYLLPMSILKDSIEM